MPTTCFRVNTPPVTLETVDEETIIVNLETGCYYDLNPVGGHVLLRLAQGQTPEAAVDSVAARWSIEAQDVRAAVLKLIDELVSEQIVVAGADAAAAAPLDPGEPPSKWPYKEPQLGRYTDMQELLLLDPVHEVDASGWPGRA